VDVDPGLSMALGSNFLMHPEDARVQSMGWPVEFVQSRFFPPYPYPMNHPNMAAYSIAERSTMPPFYPPYPPERRSSGATSSNASQEPSILHMQGQLGSSNTRNSSIDNRMGHNTQTNIYDRSMVTNTSSSGNPDNAGFASVQNGMNYSIPPWIQGQYEENSANMFYPPWYNSYMSHMQGGSPARSSNRDNGQSFSDYDPRYPSNNNLNSRENTEHDYFYPNRS